MMLDFLSAFLLAASVLGLICMAGLAWAVLLDAVAALIDYLCDEDR